MDFQSAMETFAEAWVVASAKGTFTYPPINGFQVSFLIIFSPVVHILYTNTHLLCFRYYNIVDLFYFLNLLPDSHPRSIAKLFKIGIYLYGAAVIYVLYNTTQVKNTFITHSVHAKSKKNILFQNFTFVRNTNDKSPFSC